MAQLIQVQTKAGLLGRNFDVQYPAWSVTAAEAKTIGNRLGVDWSRFPFEEFRRGIEVEFEHTSDIVQSARIALDHLREFPDYYTRLAKIETKGLMGTGTVSTVLVPIAVVAVVGLLGMLLLR